MLRKILFTVGSRLLMAIANLALLLITTQIMGAEVKGQISLFVLNISVLIMVSGVFSGPSLVYLTPRQKSGSLLLLAYVWSIASTVGLTGIIHYYQMDAGESWSHFLIIGLLECWLASHLMMLLGKEDIKSHNLLQVVKPSLTVILLLLILRFTKVSDLSSFLFAYGISSLVTYIGSVYFLIKRTAGFQMTSIRQVISESWRHGLWIQLGNLAQLLNYRVSYYFLEILTVPDTLALVRIGVYSAAIQIAESLWLLAKSVATVQYARVSNISNRIEARSLSLRLIKFNYASTVLGCVILAIIPQQLYESLLGEEFGEVRILSLLLIPGIISLSVSNGISHFFAGVGDNRYNAQASFLGLISSVGIGYIAVSYFSMWGAAAATSLTYVLQTTYQIALMLRKDSLKISDFIVNERDLLEFKKRVKDIRKSGF